MFVISKCIFRASEYVAHSCDAAYNICKAAAAAAMARHRRASSDAWRASLPYRRRYARSPSPRYARSRNRLCERITSAVARRVATADVLGYSVRFHVSKVSLASREFSSRVRRRHRARVSQPPPRKEFRFSFAPTTRNGSFASRVSYLDLLPSSPSRLYRDRNSKALMRRIYTPRSVKRRNGNRGGVVGKV